MLHRQIGEARGSFQQAGQAGQAGGAGGARGDVLRSLLDGVPAVIAPALSDGCEQSPDQVHNGDCVSSPSIDLASLKTTNDLRREHLVAGAASLASLRALLTHVSTIARAEQGSARILALFALLHSADWLEGELCVEISGELPTTFALYTEHGFGIRERLLPAFTLAVSRAEFERAVEAAPQLVTPLHIVRPEGMLVLSASGEWTAAPSAIPIAESSLHESERKTAPPPAGITSDASDEAPPRDSATFIQRALPRFGEGRRGSPDKSGVHTHPTVRRMVAIRPEALRSSGNDDD